jgi:RHH-type proline utilization regulon transcriptional repressor/proline dehydrogenase/delta 1-pyrroline-5-carboxylate dehydrogenase
VIASAFDSAGQRCSALRILCLQEDVAERVLACSKALAQLAVGNPANLPPTFGDQRRGAPRIVAHVEAMRGRGHRSSNCGCPTLQSRALS